MTTLHQLLRRWLNRLCPIGYQDERTQTFKFGRQTWLLLIVGCLMLMAASSFAAVINVPCESTAITTACLVTAQEGDTVLIAAGDCTFTDEIDIDRNISFTIAGAGTNLTTLRSPNNGQAIFIFSNSTNVFTIRDLNCVGHANNSGGFFIAGWGGRSNPGPYHFYNIQMTNLEARGISIGRGGAYGLIDHCYFKAAGANPNAHEAIDFRGSLYGTWTNAVQLGTTNACYVEDCTIDVGNNAGNGFFDAYDGAQFVFRHNFCNGNAPSGGHGTDSGFSFRTAEVYDNVFTNGGGILALQWRGGAVLNFSNKFYGFGDAMQLAFYRSCIANHCYIFAQGEGLPGQPFVWTFGSNPTNGQTLTLTNCNGDRFYYGYTFVSSYQNTSGYVVIGATLQATLTNLYNAVNLGPGAGTTYAAATTLNSTYQAFIIGTNTLTSTNMLDGNAACGYPANQQPGTITSYPHTALNQYNVQTVFGCYSWSNTLDGAAVNMSLQDTGVECNSYITNLLKLNRDYFNNTIPATNIYTPLVYPHPLQASETTNVYYTLTVNQGTGSGIYVAGQVVNISTNSIGFTHWDANPRIANTNLAATTYTMTNAADAVTAFYSQTPGVSTNAPQLFFQRLDQ